MNIDEIIDNLNKKNYAQGFGETIANENLTKIEKSIIKKYNPQNVLIVYGSLAPYEPNHSKIEHISGIWKKAIIRGKLEKRGWGSKMGYPGFKILTEGLREEIAVYVLSSNELNANWEWLDKFEGKEYKRILIKFEFDMGQLGIGNLYALKD